MQKDALEIHAFRLKPGHDLRMEIEAFVKMKNIEAGWMLTCVGSLMQANIRFANAASGTLLHGPFEIVSLAGTVSCNGCHLHISISDSNGSTTGGHLLAESTVYTTAEVVIGVSKNLVFSREDDGTTAWKELQVKFKK